MQLRETLNTERRGATNSPAGGRGEFYISRLTFVPHSRGKRANIASRAGRHN